MLFITLKSVMSVKKIQMASTKSGLGLVKILYKDKHSSLSLGVLSSSMLFGPWALNLVRIPGRKFE
jgi:hypothetical protein